MNWKWLAGLALVGILVAGMWMSKSTQSHARAPALLVITQDNHITFMPSERTTSVCVIVTSPAK